MDNNIFRSLLKISAAAFSKHTQVKGGLGL